MVSESDVLALRDAVLDLIDSTYPLPGYGKDLYIYYAPELDLIKIGRTSSPTRRIPELRRKHSITILRELLYLPRCGSIERRIREIYVHSHVGAEWYLYDHDIKRLIYALTQTGQD